MKGLCCSLAALLLLLGCPLPKAASCKGQRQICPKGFYCDRSRDYCVLLGDGGPQDSGVGDSLPREAGRWDGSLFDTLPVDGWPPDRWVDSGPESGASDVMEQDLVQLHGDSAVEDLPTQDHRIEDVGLEDAMAADRGSPEDAGVADSTGVAPDIVGYDVQPGVSVVTAHHQGSASISGTETTVAISPPVDPNASILFFGVSTDGVEPTFTAVSGQLSSAGDAIRFRSYKPTTPNTTVTWTVLQLEGIQVQRGSVDIANESERDVPLLHSVSPQRSFPLISVSVQGTSFNANTWFRAATTTDTLHLERGHQAGSGLVDWQVVEFLPGYNATVTSGALLLDTGDEEATAAVAPAVDPASSFLVVTYQINTRELPANVASHTMVARLNAGNEVAVWRSTASVAAVVSWYVVSWDRVSVQRGSTNFVPPNLEKTVTVAFTNSERSVSHCPCYQRQGATDSTDLIGGSWFRTSLTDEGLALHLRRQDGHSRTVVSWELMEFD